MNEWRGQAVNNSGLKKKKLWIMAAVLVMICGQTVLAAGEGQPQTETAVTEASVISQEPRQNPAGADQSQTQAPADPGSNGPQADQIQAGTEPVQGQAGSDQTQGEPGQQQGNTDQNETQAGKDTSQPG